MVGFACLQGRNGMVAGHGWRKSVDLVAAVKQRQPGEEPDARTCPSLSRSGDPPPARTHLLTNSVAESSDEHVTPMIKSPTHMDIWGVF